MIAEDMVSELVDRALDEGLTLEKGDLLFLHGARPDSSILCKEFVDFHPELFTEDERALLQARINKTLMAAELLLAMMEMGGGPRTPEESVEAKPDGLIN